MINFHELGPRLTLIELKLGHSRFPFGRSMTKPTSSSLPLTFAYDEPVR